MMEKYELIEVEVTKNVTSVMTKKREVLKMYRYKFYIREDKVAKT